MAVPNPRKLVVGMAVYNILVKKNSMNYGKGYRDCIKGMETRLGSRAHAIL